MNAEGSLQRRRRERIAYCAEDAALLMDASPKLVRISERHVLLWERGLPIAGWRSDAIRSGLEAYEREAAAERAEAERLAPSRDETIAAILEITGR